MQAEQRGNQLGDRVGGKNLLANLRPAAPDPDDDRLRRTQTTTGCAGPRRRPAAPDPDDDRLRRTQTTTGCAGRKAAYNTGMRPSARLAGSPPGPRLARPQVYQQALTFSQAPGSALVGQRRRGGTPPVTRASAAA